MSILEMILTGFFSGLGATLGSYLANKSLINQMEKLIKKLNNKKVKG